MDQDLEQGKCLQNNVLFCFVFLKYKVKTIWEALKLKSRNLDLNLDKIYAYIAKHVFFFLLFSRLWI